MRLILFLILLIVCSGNAFSQNYPIAKCCEAYQKVVSAVCHQDTTEAISILDSIRADYSDSCLTIYACLEAGKIYLHANRKEEAKFFFTKGLSVSIRIMCGNSSDTSCNSFGRFTWSQTAKASMCLKLSRMSREEGDLSSALNYLLLADSIHAPYKDCGNGFEDHRGRISIDIADVYLAMGDTTKALQRLFDHFNSLHHKIGYLFRLLQTRYSDAYIRKEINRIIPILRKQKPNLEEFKNTFRAFGFKVSWWLGGSEEILKLCLKSPNFDPYPEEHNYVSTPGNEDYFPEDYR